MRYIDLFAGVGGFRLAIQKNTNWDCVYSNEWDKYANSVYRKHFYECDQKDIREVDAKSIPDHDVLCAGFPCQAFSVAGKRRGFNDTRGTLFYEIARITKQKQPRILLLENVKGLLSHDKGQTFTTILNTLDELGYDAEWQVLNSQHFGVPQNRERIFIVANTRGEPAPQIFPIKRKKREDSNACELTGKSPQKFIKTRYLGQNGSLISDMTTLQASEIAHIIDASYLSRSRVYTETAPTVRDYGAGGNKMPMVNGIRRLMPVECERLQGFPDDWTALGADGEEISDRQRYKMMGNAVTVNVVSAIVTDINKQLTTTRQ